MAEERSILLKIELDVDQLQKNAKTAEAELAKIVPKMNELKKAGQTNTVEYKTLAVESQKYNKQLTDSVKAIQANKTATENQSGSLREMRDILAASKIEYQNLSQVQRDSKGGQAMAKQMDDLKTSINEIEQGFGTFTGQVGNYGIAAKDAEEETKRLAGNMEHLGKEIVTDVSASISKMEDKLYDMVKAGDTTSKEFRDLQKSTAEYKKIIIEVDASIDALAESGGALGSALQLGQGVVAGYQAVAGVTALIGAENEELLAVLVKLEAAQAVLSSLEAAQLAMRRSAIKVTQMQATAQRLLTLAIGEGSKASKVFRGALLATGVGALVIGIGLLISNFDKLKAAFKSTSTEQDALNSTMEAYRSGATEAFQLTNKVGNAFALAQKGVFSKEKALKIYNDTLGDAFGKQTDYNKAEKVFKDKTPDFIKSAADRAQATALMAEAAKLQVENLTATMENQVGWADSFMDSFDQGLNFATGNIEEYQRRTKASQDKAVKDIQDANNKKIKSIQDLATKMLQDVAERDAANGIADETDQEMFADWKARQEEKAKIAKEIAQRIVDIQVGNLDLSFDNERKVIEAYYSSLETQAADNAAELIKLASEKNEDLRILDEKELEENRKRISEKYDAEVLAVKDNATLVTSLTQQKNLTIEGLQIDFNNKIVARAEALIETEKQLNEERVKQEADALKRIGVLNAELALERAKGTPGELQAWKNLQDAKIAELEASQTEQLSVTTLSEAERIAIIAESELAIQQIKNETFEQEAQQDEQRKLRIKDIAATSLSSAQSLSDSIFQIAQNQYTNELNALTDKTDAENSLLQQQLDAGIISQTEFNAKKSALDSQAAAKEAEIKKKQFKADRNAALIQAAINTAVGVTAASPVVPLMALAAVLGGIQIALIASQPEPKFEKGGQVKSKQGVFGGNLHSNGGTKGVFEDGTRVEVEKDEAFFILNRKATAAIASLSAHNQKHGGNPMMQHGGVLKFQGGGSFAAVASKPTMDKYAEQNAIIQAVSNLPNPVVFVEDMNSAQQNIVEVEQRASW